jgi:DNA-binding transcriptional MerR regulator
MANMNLMQTAECSEQSPTSSNENEDMRVYSIGDMASEHGVTLRTLRFYEDRGLLHPRREGTTRYYTTSDRERLKMIMKGKHLGFTLTEIKDMIAAKNSSTSSSYELALKPEQVLAQINHLERQRQEIDQAITELRAVHSKNA